MTEPKMVARRWTSAEENELKEMLDAGMTASEIAPKINRTTQAIYARLQRIYISRHPIIGG
jgi:IS30 family transposase